MLHLHSHRPPILHRDLKSPNVLVDRDWRAKITDFNLSCMMKCEASGSSVDSLLANNPRWLAPEVSFMACHPWLCKQLLCEVQHILLLWDITCTIGAKCLNLEDIHLSWACSFKI